jgi:hypothetical protein
MSATVDYYLDPVCPWTWLASRWLLEVVPRRDLTVRWRPFSLGLLNEGKPIPPQFDTPKMRDHREKAARAIRVLAALSQRGDYETAGRFYSEFGRRLHEAEESGENDSVEAAATAAGVTEPDPDDAGVTEFIKKSLEEGLAIAGPDVGSPVLRIGDSERGFHGPIVRTRVTGERAAALFDHLVALQSEDAFFEIKRGRTSGPDVAAWR